MPNFTYVPANEYAKQVVKNAGRRGVDLTPYIDALDKLKQNGDGMHIQLGENDKASTIKKHIRDASERFDFSVRFDKTQEDDGRTLSFRRVEKGKERKRKEEELGVEGTTQKTKESEGE